MPGLKLIYVSKRDPWKIASKIMLALIHKNIIVMTKITNIGTFRLKFDQLLAIDIFPRTVLQFMLYKFVLNSHYELTKLDPVA